LRHAGTGKTKLSLEPFHHEMPALPAGADVHAAQCLAAEADAEDARKMY
jgi:hypothetical protein